MTQKQNPEPSQLRNVMVKTVRAHDNPYGDKFTKAVDDRYRHPRPHADIEAGLVVPEATAEAKAPSRTRKTPAKGRKAS